MRLLFVFLFLVVVALASHAQDAAQSPRSVYAGQKVTAIYLVANPNRDVEPFLPLVTQKPGEPYSQQKIADSIAALEHTGQFHKVQVTVIPDISGLRLNFLLEPAYYLGIVRFPGATKAFTYARLLQVVDLQDEDPYNKSRTGVAEQALRDFLHHNGYFQARVRFSASIDDANQLVNLTFSVTLGKRARIGSVNLNGPDAAENSRLRHAFRSLRARFSGALLRPGKSYTPERISGATALIRKVLAKQQRLAAHVQEEPPVYHDETNTADVSLRVDLGPVVSVRVTGARLSVLPFLSQRQQKKLIPMYSEQAIDRDLVQEGQQNLIEYFQKKGYFDVQVKINFQRQPNHILVEYAIDKGKKQKVDRISFHGNHEVGDRELSAAVAVKQAHFWSHGSVSQKLLKQSSRNLAALYRDRGFENVKVTAETQEHGTQMSVGFTIEEGNQSIVEDVTVTGNDQVPEAEVAAPLGLQLRPGMPFSPRKVAEDRNRISAAYLNRGYLNAEVATRVDRDPSDAHHVKVTYAVVEHQMVRIGRVIYLGQENTRLSLIHKTAQLDPEAPMRKGDMLAAESRLYDLNIFDWSSVGSRKPITDQTEESTLVKVHEAKRNEITYGFGFEISHRGGNVPSGTVAVPGGPPVDLGGNQIAPSQSTFASPRGLIEFNRRNMRGLGETAGASLLLSRLDQRAIATYNQPHFLGSSWGSLTSLSVERTTENPLFGANLGDASFQVERLISRKNNTRLQVRYDFNKTVLFDLLVPDLVSPRDRNVHLSTFSATVLRDTRDKPLDAHTGAFNTITLGITPTALGSSANFAKLTAQYAFYRPVHSVVLANSIRLGLVKAFADSFVPTSQLYFSGGGNSLRGFPINQAGPQRLVPFCDVLDKQTGCTSVTVPVGGRQLFILNSEVRFPLRIMKQLGGVLFYDGGNVYSAINLRNFVDNYSNTVGVGLRYSTPIGPVRFDIGRNLNAPPGIDALQYYITLGQAF